MRKYEWSRLPEREMPKRRVSEGRATCSTVELLAAVIGGSKPIETAVKLLSRYGTLRNIQASSAAEIADIEGIGPRTAAAILAAIEIGARINGEEHEGRGKYTIHGPLDIVMRVKDRMALLDQEELWVLVLNIRNNVLDEDRLYKGTVSSTSIRIGEVFATAIRRKATAIVVVHNHPSGDTSPSSDDVAITRNLVSAGKLLDIEVLDHIICGKGEPGWVSLRERGLGFS